MLSLILNLSTWVIIGLSLSFCATWHNFRPICPTLIIVKWWNGPTATDKRQRERGREERREWNLTSDVLSWLTEAWQRRDQACHSAVDTPMSMKMNSHSRFLWLAPTLSMNITYLAFCFFSSKLHNHTRALSNCFRQRCTTGFFLFFCWV